MKTLKDALADFREARAKMEKLDAATPRIMGKEAVDSIHHNFDIQGYDNGQTVQQWPERSAKTNTAYDRRYGVKGSVYSSQNPLEIQTGNLYDSIRHKENGRSTFVGFDEKKVPYGEAQNEGLNNLPVRQFMPMRDEPPNAEILKRIMKKLKFERDRIMQKFKK